jgi:hypothetical protein
MKLLIALLSVFLSTSLLADGLDAAFQLKILDTKGNKYILPAQKSEVDLALTELNQNIKTQTSNEALKSKGYSVEIKTAGDCKNSNSKDCMATLIGRRYFQISTIDLKKVIDTYTTDLRYAKDKSFKISGLSIERHHWDINEAGAEKIDEQAAPMNVGQEYILKKCRNGFMVEWRCNSIAYELTPVDENTFVLLGRQIVTSSEPGVYKTSKCPQGETLCTLNFTDLQKRNSSDGILSLTVFKKDLTAHLVSINEVNLSSVAQPDEAKKLLKGERLIESGIEGEYGLLRAKLSALNEDTIATHSSQKSDSNSKSLRYFIFLIAISVSLLTVFFATKTLNIPRGAKMSKPKSEAKKESATLSFDAQRDFLEEMTDPVALSQGMINLVIEGLQKKGEANSSEIQKLEKVLLAIKKIASAIERNRSAIISQKKATA